MKISEFNITNAAGVCLLSDYYLSNQTYPCGHILTPEDIIFFKLHKISKVYGAILDEDDIIRSTAIGMLAAKLCGTSTSYFVDDNSVCQIVAATDGILNISSQRVARFNRFSPDWVLNTLPPFSIVKQGEVIAKLELSTPIISQEDVDEMLFKLAGNEALLQLSPLFEQQAALLYGKITSDSSETEHFTAVVKKLIQDYSPYGVKFASEFSADYSLDSLADTLQDALKKSPQLIFILLGTQSSVSHSQVADAMHKIVDAVIYPQSAILGATDIFVAQKNQTKIVALPYNYVQISAANLDNIIKKVLFSEKIIAELFADSQPCYLSAGEIVSAEDVKFIAPQKSSKNHRKASIAAVVLAAGEGRRSGHNKLMTQVDNDEPLFMRAVKTAIASDASPIFVITGADDELMHSYLDNYDVNIICNPNYRAGVKTSISMGLKSIPDFCDGTIIIPADMPNLTAKDLNKLIAAFDADQEKQICMFSHKGVKYNPIIWSKSLYDEADIVPENSAIRGVFLAHSDYTNLVSIRDKQKLFDVTYPADIELITNQANSAD